MAVAWAPIAGYEGCYEVSSSGQVRSLPRKGRLTERILKPGRHSYGIRYATVVLRRDGKSTTKMIHKLVAEAFIGPCPEGQEVRHGPKGYADNSVGNLCYGTHAENMADMVRDGTRTGRKPSGKPAYVKVGYHPKRKLSEANVIEIRRRRDAKEATVAALAREYGVHPSCIDHVIARRTFRNVA